MSAESQDRRFSSLGFDRHYENMRWIDEGDVVVPSIAGTGSSLVANLLVELGLHYVDLTKAVLRPDGSSVPLSDPITRRLEPDDADAPDGARQRPRFMKTHLPAEEFEGCTFGAVWILVRDPRDAIYSWHRYHRSFAEAEWEEVPESFEEFLRLPFFTGRTPVGNWTSFYAGWLERASACEHASVIRFEDLKREPLETMQAALREVEVEVPDEDLERAVERSSYEAMRAHEDEVAESDPDRPRERIMRRGKVEEWREWMTPELSSYFSGDDLRSVARRFGYAVPAPL